MRYLLVFCSMMVTFGMPRVSWALFEITEFARIPSTLFGPSGLLFTQSTDTLLPGKMEVGLGLIQEESDKPDFSITRFSPTLTMGVTPTIEVSAQIPYFAKIDADAGKIDESEPGDLNLSIKWRFMEPSMDLSLPGLGLSFTVFLPTGEREVGAGSVDSWGLKALLISSAEIEVGFPPNTIFLGVYSDGGIYIQDTGDATEENHGIIDLGLLMPLSASRRIQLLLEGNARIQRETPFGSDYTAITTGLRYISKHVALNVGWQHRFNQNLDNKKFDDSDRFILHGSYYFDAGGLFGEQTPLLK